MEKIRRFEDIVITPETLGEAGFENDAVISPEVMNEILKDKDLNVTKPFHVFYAVDREKDSDTIHAGVDVSGEIEAECARCLDTVFYKVDLHLETDYLPAAPDMPSDLEAERTSSETGYYRKSVRLGEYILSELVLALPIRFICIEECKGLCPVCGGNMNREECNCKAPEDPRLKKLADLKDKLRRK